MMINVHWFHNGVLICIMFYNRVESSCRLCLQSIWKEVLLQRMPCEGRDCPRPEASHGCSWDTETAMEMRQVPNCVQVQKIVEDSLSGGPPRWWLRRLTLPVFALRKTVPEAIVPRGEKYLTWYMIFLKHVHLWMVGNKRCPISPISGAPEQIPCGCQTVRLHVLH